MKKPCAALLLLIIPVTALADTCETHKTQAFDLRNPLKAICIYEPNTIGYTWDSDDEAFMDFKLSIRYQMFPDYLTRGMNFLHPGLGYSSALYFSFSGRFGQYLGTRDSSPVVGKRFNPKIFLRFWGDPSGATGDPANPDHSVSSYVDLGYAHESNGQSIDTKAAYDQAVANAKHPGDANDQLSHGWDDVEVTWKYERVFATTEGFHVSKALRLNFDVTNYIGLKYFLPDGLLQGTVEEYDPAIHTDPEGRPRRRVDGISEAIKGIVALGDHKMKYYLSYVTGYADPGRYNTYRGEFSIVLLSLPLTVWDQWGYNSDLAQYYKKVNSYGIYLDIGSF
jgi:hypothetical protein